MPNCINQFFAEIGVKRHRKLHGPHSFRNVIRVSGWKHCWDLLIRKGLCRCLWFPKFLASLKNLVYFLRDEGLRFALVKTFKGKGMTGLARMVEKAGWHRKVFRLHPTLARGRGEWGNGGGRQIRGHRPPGPSP